MKRSFWQHTLATLALVLAVPAAVFAQADPTLVNENNVVVANGAAPQGYLLNQFPVTEVGGEADAIFTVFNHGDADLEVGFITGSAQFEVSGQPASAPNTSATVAAGASADFTVAFKPTVLGTDAAELTIPTNAPGAESSYVLKVAGEAVTTGSLPIAPNIEIKWAEKKGVVAPLKVKLDKKSGQYKITGSAVVTNNGPVEIALADVEVWYSADNILDESVDTKLGQLKKPLKKIKVAKTPKPGKPIKYKVKKAKIQALAPTADGFIFLKAYLVSPTDAEITQLDNIVNMHYPLP